MSKLYVISTGRNPSFLVQACVESVQTQTLQPDLHILIDDMSDNDTIDYLSTIMSSKYSNLVITQNHTRKYRLRNIYESSIDKDPDDIICIVDSDDSLATSTALETVSTAYANNPQYEYVYTNYVTEHGEPGGCQPIPDSSWNPYEGSWITSHMCTFKVKAIQGISIKNFLDVNGNWFQIGTDQAFSLPILYRLWKRDNNYSSVGFINKPLYKYTWDLPSRPRRGEEEADKLAADSVRNSILVKQRRYIKDENSA